MNSTDPETGGPATVYGAFATTRLVRTGSLDRIREGMALIGYPVLPAAFFQQVKDNVEYLERCLDEADAVLRGDLGAATRLWLLLREPVVKRVAIPESVLDEIVGNGRYEQPMVIEGDHLLTLVAGVVRAANQPVEAEAMLENLGRLVDTLFLIEWATRAAEQALNGQPNPLKTFVTAWQAPQWRRALEHDHGSSLTPPMAVDTADVQPVKDREPFDPEGWPPDPDPRTALDNWSSRWDCLPFIRKEMSQIDRWGPRYTIESLSNSEACAGQTITIRGHNFGPSGRVQFPTPDPNDPLFGILGADPGGVAATRWTDTEIDVVVPPWATSGELRLLSFTRNESRCKIVFVYRLGNTYPFQGGLAGIWKIFLNGQEIDLESKTPTNLKPGHLAVVGWQASSGSTVRVTVEIQTQDGSVLVHQDGLPGGLNSTTLTVPVVPVPTPMVLMISAISSCGPATRSKRIPIWLSIPPILSIEYIEVTQGVQTDLADVVTGRGMPTVAYKDTAVRVHLHCDRSGWWENKLNLITGTLVLDKDNRKRLMPTNPGDDGRWVMPTRSGTAAIKGISNPNNTNETLNFTIPAAYLTPGFHHLTVRVACMEPSGRIEVQQSTDWMWHEKSPLRVRCLWLAGDGDFHKADMLDYAARALDFLPTPLTDIGITSRVWYSHNYDLSTEAGWEDLLDDIEDEWDDADETSGVRWLAIIPPSERRPGSIPPFSLKHGGIAGSPGVVAIAIGDRPEAGAHELGHTLGLNHVRLANDGQWNPKGPWDAVDNGGRLRRPPFDVRSSQAVPLPAGDLMSYFNPVRPGITTWMRLFNMPF